MNSDRCCSECRTPGFPEVCRDKHECWCHYEHARDWDTGNRRTPDPTGNEAVNNIMREKYGRKRRRP